MNVAYTWQMFAEDLTDALVEVLAKVSWKCLIVVIVSQDKTKIKSNDKINKKKVSLVLQEKTLGKENPGRVWKGNQ